MHIASGSAPFLGIPYSFPDVVCLQEIGGLGANYRFHSLNVAHFMVHARKCLGLALLLRRVASYVF